MKLFSPVTAEELHEAVYSATGADPLDPFGYVHKGSPDRVESSRAQGCAAARAVWQALLFYVNRRLRAPRPLVSRWEPERRKALQ